jgi:hypothetical protein
MAIKKLIENAQSAEKLDREKFQLKRQNFSIKKVQTDNNQES